MKKSFSTALIALCTIFQLQSMYDITENFDDIHLVVANTSCYKSYIIRLRSGNDPIEVVMPETADGRKASQAFVTQDTFKLKPKTLFYINKKKLQFPIRMRVWEDYFYPAYDYDSTTQKNVETSRYNLDNTLTSKLITEDDANQFNIVEIQQTPANDVVLATKKDTGDDYQEYDVIQ